MGELRRSQMVRFQPQGILPTRRMLAERATLAVVGPGLCGRAQRDGGWILAGMLPQARAPEPDLGAYQQAADRQRQ